MAVERCICHQISFAQLIAIARREGLGFEELSARTRCSTGCRMCEPYVRVALETGRASIPVMSAAAASEVIARRAGSRPGTGGAAEGEPGVRAGGPSAV